jgi:hypothetical protein
VDFIEDGCCEMREPNWFVRLLGGYLPWVTKPFGEWLGKMLFYVSISATVLLVAGKIFPAKPTTTIDRIETQIVNECPQQDKIIGLHLNIWKFRIGAGI